MMIDTGLTIDAKLWGPSFWDTMEAVAVTFDPQNAYSREQTLIFFYSLQGVIPCSVCREHYFHYYENNPIHDALENKLTLFQWVHKLRNSVNEKMKKDAVPFDTFIEKIEQKFQVKLNN